MFLITRNLLSLHSKSIKERNMKQKLQRIASELESINRDMQREEQVYEAELKDRLAKNLQGEEAVKHYNAWMAAYGMNDLMVE